MSEVTKKKPAIKSTGKKKVDDKKLSYIFFGILVVAIIGFSILLLLPKSPKYVKNFGDDIVTTIEIKEKDETIRMLVKIKDNDVIEQKGTLTFIADGKSQDAEGKEVAYKIYEASFEPLDSDEEPEVVQIKVYEKSLILAYDSGEIIEYERK